MRLPPGIEQRFRVLRHGSPSSSGTADRRSGNTGPGPGTARPGLAPPRAATAGTGLLSVADTDDSYISHSPPLVDQGAGPEQNLRPGPPMPCQALPRQALPGPAAPGRAWPCLATVSGPGQLNVTPVRPCHAVPSRAVPSHAAPRLAAPSLAMPCIAMPDLASPRQWTGAVRHRPGPSMPCPAAPCLAQPRLARPSLALPRRASPSPAAPCRAMPSRAWLPALQDDVATRSPRRRCSPSCACPTSTPCAPNATPTPPSPA